MAATERLEQGEVRNAERSELAVQPGGAVVPVDLVGIAGEALVPRPVQRMHVQDRRVLTGPFDVAEQLPERVVAFAVVTVSRLPHRLMEVDRRRDRPGNGKHRRVPVGKPQRPLASHAHAEQGDARRLHAESPRHLAADHVDHVPLRRDQRIERGHDAVEPPGTAAAGRDHRKPVGLHEAAQRGLFLEPPLPQPVEIDDGPAGKRIRGRVHLARMPRHLDDGPVGAG